MNPDVDKELLKSFLSQADKPSFILESKGSLHKLDWANEAGQKAIDDLAENYNSDLPFEQLHFVARAIFKCSSIGSRVAIDVSDYFSGSPVSAWCSSPGPGLFVIEIERDKEKDTKSAKQAEIEIESLQKKVQELRLRLLDEKAERNKSESTLFLAEEKFELLVNAMEDLFWIFDPNKDRMLYVSPAVEKIWNVSAHDCLNTPIAWIDKVLPEDQHIIYKSFSILQSGRQSYDEFRIKTLDGNILWISNRSYPILDEQGHVSSIVGVARDITDRVVAEKELKAAHRDLDQLFNVTAPICLINQNFQLEKVNDSFCDYFQVSHREALGQNCHKFSPCPEPGAPVQSIEDILNGKSEHYFESATTLSNGDTISFVVHAKPMHDINGNISHIVEIFHDITVRKQYEKKLENALELSEQRKMEMQYLLDASNAVSSNTGFDSAARAVFDIAKKATGATAGYVALLSPNGEENEVLFLDDGGMPCTVDPELPMPVRGLRSIAYFKNEVALDNDFMNSQWIKYMPPGHVAMTNVMFAPLTMEGNVIGIMGLANKTGDFTETERQLAKALGEITSIAFQRAMQSDQMYESQMRYKRLSEATFEGISIHSGGKMVDANHALTKMWGYSYEEILGKDPVEIMAPESKNLVKYHIDNSIMEPYEAVALNKSGNRFDVEITGKNFVLDGQQVRVAAIRDITDRKKAERDLRIKDQAIESSMSAIVFWDMDGTITYVNESFCSLWNYSTEEITGKEISKLWTDKATGERINSELKTKGEFFSEEYAITALRKKIILQITANLVTDENGSPICMMASMMDITGHKKTVRQLKLIEHSINTSTASVYWINNRGNFVYVNDAACHSLGYSREELLSMSVYNIDPSVPSNSYPTHWEKTKEHGGLTFETMNIRKNGEIFPVEVTNQYIQFDDEEYEFAFIVDITERKKVEQALIESEQKLSRIFAAAPVGIIILTQRIITFLNNTVEKMLGYDNDYLLGKNVRVLYYSQQEYERVGNEVYPILNLQNTTEVETQLRKSDSDKMDVHIKLNLLNKENDIMEVVCSISDITERKRVQEEMQQIAKLESLGTLAGGIAHNFKNLLTSMSLNTEMAIMHKEHNQEFLEKIKSSIGQATALATRFQTYSKGGEPLLEPTNITDVLNEAESLALSGSNIIPVFDFAHDNGIVLADAKQLNEVFMNLLINAQQAMPRGGRIFLNTKNQYVPQRKIPGLSAGDYLRISVRDEGVGIPKGYIDDIFVPFFTTKEKGHGLGLSTVHFIIQKHKGTIRVKSEYGAGTCFDVFLPAYDEEQAKVASVTRAPSLIRPGIRILLLDDDQEVLTGCSSLLKALGAKITGTANGYDTVKNYIKARQAGRPFDVVILDLTIKGSDLSGEDTLNWLLREDPTCKAIVFSGHSNRPIVANYKLYGFAGRIEKPVDLNQFVSEINRVIEL